MKEKKYLIERLFKLEFTFAAFRSKFKTSYYEKLS